MSARAVLSGIAAVLLATAMAAGAWPARADEPSGPVPTTVEIRAPAEAVTGAEVTVLARLTAERGQPVPGQVLDLVQSALFLGVDGEARVASAVTGADGAATFLFTPGTAGENTITARFAGAGALAPSAAAQVVGVEEGPPSYSETAGIRVPGIGLWLLVAILGTVWGVFLVVMLLLGMIASEGRSLEAAGGMPDA